METKSHGSSKKDETNQVNMAGGAKRKRSAAVRPIDILTGASERNRARASHLCIVLRVRTRHGGLAQLEERVLCKHEVTGSSPVFSTIWADSSVG